MIKMNRQEINIKLTNGEYQKVSAWCYKNLAAHKDIDTWVISHTLTGYRIAYFNGKYKHIRPMIKEISCIGINWSIIEDPYKIISLLYNNVRLIEKLRDIVSKYEAID